MPEEAGGYVGRALAKMGVFLRTKGSFDVLKALCRMRASTRDRLALGLQKG